MTERPLQGALTFLGFAVSVLAVFYFAVEYIPRVSEWSQLAALALLGLFFALMGTFVDATIIGRPFFSGPRLRWLRPTVVLWLLAIVCGIVAEIRFLTIDDVPKPLKILLSLIVGVGLIAWVARAGTGPRKPSTGRTRTARRAATRRRRP